MPRLAALLFASLAVLLATPSQAAKGVCETGKGRIEYNDKLYQDARGACSASAASRAAEGWTEVKLAVEHEGQVLCRLGDPKDPDAVTEQHIGKVLEPRPAECDMPKGVLAKGEALPAPNQRGMTNDDDKVFKEIAAKRQVVILVRESNPAAVRFTGKKGYLPKPEKLKAKTMQGDPDADPNVGLAVAGREDPRLKEMLAAAKQDYDAYIAELTKHGFKVQETPPFLVVHAKTGEPFYSDIDLHGVYDKKGKPAWTKAFNEILNKRLSDRLLQHGPHDCWEKRNSEEAGPNRGPQPPVSVYLPAGETLYLKTREEMMAFYAKQKIDWPYAEGAKKQWCN